MFNPRAVAKEGKPLFVSFMNLICLLSSLSYRWVLEETGQRLFCIALMLLLEVCRF